MKYQHIFRNTSKPIGLIICFFVVISLLFSCGIILYDYKSYIKNYQLLQKEEVKTINDKTNQTLNHVDELLELMQSRIYAANGNVTGIQAIISSIHNFHNLQPLPNFHKILFYKLTDPKMVITRFGLLPLDPKQLLADIEIIKNKGSLISANNNGIIDRMLVFGTNGGIEGILEIQMPLVDFWNFLGTYRTVYFDDEFLTRGTQEQGQGRLFPIKKKPTPSFKIYLNQNYATYTGLGLYIIFSLLLLGIGVTYLAACFYKIYESRVSKLEQDLSALQEKEKGLVDKLSSLERRFHNHSVSCQLHRKFFRNIKNKQIEFANSLAESLDTIDMILQDHLSSMIYEESSKLLALCKDQIINLSLGLWEPSVREEVNLKEIMNNISTLFIEKIEASNITLEMNYISKEANSYEGDAVFVELLLINVIGNRLYRLPKQGRILIFITREKEDVNIEIHDNGYGYYTRNRFDFCIEDVIFQQLCLENNITYKTTKNQTGGMNVTNILLPKPQADPPKDNVVQLFK